MTKDVLVTTIGIKNKETDMSTQQIAVQEITARDAYDAADAIITALPNAPRRALAGEIHDLFLYLKCQMHREGPRSVPKPGMT